MGIKIRVDGTMIRIEYDPNVRSMDDAIEKNLLAGAAKAGKALALAPLTLAATAGKAALGAVGLAPGKKNPQADPALSQAQEAVKIKEQELATAQQELQALEQQAQQAPAEEPQAMPAAATAGAGVEGMDSATSGSPAKQPGTDAPAPPTAEAPITKTYFKDNFGIEGGELLSLLEKSGETDVASSVELMLRKEQQAILKTFDWWEDNDWDILDLKDNDFNMLLMYPDRLELPLRQTINAVKKGGNSPWDSWHSRLDAENRLSRRERGVLSKCHSILKDNGDMNSQTLSSYGVNASSTEIASLIKSYGYLFGVNVVGRGTKHDDRTLYYGTPKPPIFLKTVDSFIGNLWEVDGELTMTPMNAPRLILPFKSERGQDYSVVLKQRLGVENIMWEGQKFIIEGDYAVQKAAELALPHLSLKKQEGAVLIAALNGNDDASKVLAYNVAKPQDQVGMLKEWNISEDQIGVMAGVITNGR